MSFWNLITFIGDAIITLPAAVAITLWLCASQKWRLALDWALLLGAGLMVVVVSKIAFIGWGVGLPGLDFTGVSGHAMRAMAVLPVFAWLACGQCQPVARLAACLTGVVLATLIAASRLALHVHSTSEVVLGLVLGGMVALAFLARAASQMPVRIRPWILGLTMAALAPTAQAEPAPTHEWLTKVALSLSGHERPYVRSPDGRLTRGPRPETDSGVENPGSLQ